MTKLTRRQMILIAAVEKCGGELATRFSEEDLSVLAWRQFPDSFGMVRHEHPDRKEMSVILSTRVPIGTPFLVRVSPGLWSLTQECLDEVERIAEFTK